MFMSEMTFNLSLFLHEVLYTAYLLASWLCLTWLIRFVELVCCALFSSFCFELYNSFNRLWAQDTKNIFIVISLDIHFIAMDKLDGAAVRIAPLDGTNYDNWKFRIEMLLTARKLFGYASGETRLAAGADDAQKAAFKEKDDEARAIISIHVSDNQLIHVRNCKSAAEAWEALKNQYQRKSLVRRIDLRDKMSYMRMQEGENALEFLDKMCRLRDQLLEMGGLMPENVFCEIVLGKLPHSYNSLRTTLDTIGEAELSWEKVKGLILTVADRAQIAGNGESFDNALVTRQVKTSKSKFDGKKCFNCQKVGHLAKDCWSKPKHQKGYAKGKCHDGKYIPHNQHTLLSSTQALNVDSNNLDTWIIDSGATQHMSSKDVNMRNYEAMQGTKKIYLADNKTLEAKGQGDITMKCMLPNQESTDITFGRVLHVPDLQKNLISVPSITKNGGSVNFTDEKCEISTQEGLVAVGHKKGNLFVLDFDDDSFQANATTEVSTRNQSLELWHLRLGHLGYESVKKMAGGDIVIGMKTNTHKFERDCDGCALGKQSRKPFSKKGTERASDILELVHSDVCGPMHIVSDGGARYLLTFIDDHSRMTVTYFIKNKYEVLGKFKEYLKVSESFTGKKLKRLRSDNGGEYISKEFNEFCKQQGIIQEPTIPGTPQQNGVAERMNRTLLECARSMLFHAKMPLRFWADAINTAAYIRNRCTSTVLNWHTPYEIWFKRQPNISNLKVFGCNAYVHTPKEKRKKLDAKSTKCIFIGYADPRKGYRMYDPSTKKVILSRDVKFCEGNFENVANAGEEIREESISVYHNFERDLHVIYPETYDTTEIHSNNLQDQEPVGDNEAPRRSERERRSPNRYGEWIDAEAIDLESSSDAENLVEHAILSIVPEANIEEPRSIKDAWNCEYAEKWRKATDSEYESLLKNETWTLVPLPDNKHAIGSKWVFKVKHRADGTVDRFKARLVAQGYSQQPGVDYNEVFAPVTRANSIRVILSIANALNMEIHQMDVKTAFLNGRLDEEIYMKQPKGYVDNENPDHVCKLQKSLYGLKQAARCWNDVIDNYFKDSGYVQNRADPCVYVKNIIRNGKKSTMIVAIHVDDLILACNDAEMMATEKKDLQGKFEMKDQGEAHHILGMSILRNRDKHILTISQKTYLENVLRRFNMQNCKPVATPIDPNLSLVKLKDDEQSVNLEEYQALIGCLTYAMTISRPDLATAVGILSKFMSKPSQSHWKCAKRVLRYIKGSLNVGLKFDASSQTAVDVIGFTDADWAGDVDERKSTSGYVFRICGGTISWRSKRQEIVALSSTEAEYIALSFAAQELMWLRSFLKDLGYEQQSNLLYEDNQGAIALSKNPENHSRTKHIDVRYITSSET